METSHFLAANKTANIMIGLADKRNIAMVVMTLSDADLCEALLLLLLHSHYHYHSMLAQKGLNNQTRASLQRTANPSLPIKALTAPIVSIVAPVLGYLVGSWISKRLNQKRNYNGDYSLDMYSRMPQHGVSHRAGKHETKGN